jgi:hypothetical protein
LNPVAVILMRTNPELDSTGVHMQSTIDSVDLQMLSAYEFNKLPALVRTELLASGRLGGKVSKHTKLVCGVGFNDAHYLVDRYIDKVKVRCPAYSAWVNMLKRCYSIANLYPARTHRCSTVTTKPEIP